jgi:hypothetical protein
MKTVFTSARAEFYDLLSLFTIPILRIPGAKALLRVSEWADQQLFRFAHLSRHGAPWSSWN